MPSPAEWFVSKLKAIAIEYEEYLKDIKPMDLTEEYTNYTNMRLKIYVICVKCRSKKEIQKFEITAT